MTITTAGNVGIGTTSPGALLDVYKNTTGVVESLRLSNPNNSSSNGVMLGFGGDGAHPVANFIQSVRDGLLGHNSLQFGTTANWNTTDATVAMTLDSNGNVGIGTNNPAVTLTVVGDIRTGTSGTNGCVQGFGGTSIAGTCSSDSRLKIVTGTVTGVLDKLSNLDLITYKWNQTAADVYRNSTDVTNTGFLAQQVETQFPELVTTDSNGYRQLNYSTLSLYGLEAIKEQQTQVKTLSTTIDSLTLMTDTSITTLAGLQASVDTNLLTISGTLTALDTRLSALDDTKTGKLTTLDNRILSLEKTVGLSASALSHETRIADLESQMTTLKDENLALMDFFTTFKSGGIVTKDKDNNVDLLGGKLTATIVETGALVIDVIDPDAATAGVDSIMPVATDPGSDGKSVFIKTTAVTSDSRIYVTPIGSTKNQVPFIDSVKDGKGFTVSVDDPVLVDLRFNWLIVGKR